MTQRHANQNATSGKVVYVYAFDVAYNMTRQTIGRLLGQPVSQFVVDVTKHSPRQLFFCRPEMIRLPDAQRMGPNGAVAVQRTVKLFPVGAISVAVHVPFTVSSVDDLNAYVNLRFDSHSLQDEVRQLAEDVRWDLEPFCVRPVQQLSEPEGYTVFCVNTPPAPVEGKAESAQAWLGQRRRQIAGLLTEESDPQRLSEQEIEESTALSLSYHEQDLTVIDWNAAVIVDQPANFDEIIHVIELANVQLAELEAYDRILDDTLDRSYRDLAGQRGRGRANVIRSLREIRVDLARVSDELVNITKFFGDWHLARIYQNLASRFHLADWHNAMITKLRTLNELYQLLKQDQTNRWMLILEISVVVLFVLDVVILLVPLVR